MWIDGKKLRSPIEISSKVFIVIYAASSAYGMKRQNLFMNCEFLDRKKDLKKRSALLSYVEQNTNLRVPIRKELLEKIQNAWCLKFILQKGRYSINHYWIKLLSIKYCSLHKKWSFPLRISSVNVTKSAVLYSGCFNFLKRAFLVNWRLKLLIKWRLR